MLHKSPNPINGILRIFWKRRWIF